MGEYQLNCAETWPELYEKAPRRKRAIRIIKTLEDFLGKARLKELTLLDVGSSTGIISDVLATRFKEVVGIDIEKAAVRYAQRNFKRRNLKFKLDDAMNLSFKDNGFDVVICTQVYEHVPDSNKLFEEIYRVLKPGGICYFAGINGLWHWEPHYRLPLLSWLPKTLANLYVRLAGRADRYYENPKTYWGLQKLTHKFIHFEYTQKILRNPKKFGYGTLAKLYVKYLLWLFSPFAKYFPPTFFWLLVKPQSNTQEN